MAKPSLTFFTELKSDELARLFNGQLVIDDLKALDAAISLGILDLSDARAEVVKRLNKAGIPVVAWLLLPEEEGYWFNIDNHQAAAARYVAFRSWTLHHNLQWAGIGLDIEPDIKDIRLLQEKKPDHHFLSTLLNRYFDKKRVAQAQKAYQDLVDVIHNDGYWVESYHLPLISEERRARSSVLQRTAGLVDVDTDREVLMLYSSFLRPNGDAILWSYAPDADAIGVGNTGGGVDIEGVADKPPLSWEEFTHDLRLCMMQEKPIHVFCLEGCVKQGYLSKLSSFDWDQPTSLPIKVKKVRGVRTAITAGLWLLERPWVILISILSLIGLGFLFKHNDQD